ncbi:hypothetical protein C8Q76DRAFT_859844 [Earliella scabrosa]|nr:hypothetical protein C8Q76DRAFT_859844 [Earliella scabrosa]
MAQPPVHRIWSIAEVIREVVQHHEDDPGTLASCACVSRAFSAPALEVLWKVADGLVNLFSLLSKSMKTLFGGEDKYHVLYAPIDDKEWARFGYYAAFTREFTNERSELIDGMTFCALMERTKGGPLLPRLRLLTWNVGHMSSASLPLFLSPTLRKISIELTRVFPIFPGEVESRAEYATASALRIIHSRVPNIVHMQLVTAGNQSTLDALSLFCHLRILVLKRVIYHPLRSLPYCGRLQDLKELDVQVPRRCPDSMTSSPEVAGMTNCNKLETLRLSGKSAHVLAMLAAIRAPALRTLKLSTDSPKKLYPLAQTISSQFSQSLCQLFITIRAGFTEMELRPWTKAESFSTYFAPLLSIRQLVVLSLKLPPTAPLLVTEEDIDAISNSWPYLIRLVMPNAYHNNVLDIVVHPSEASLQFEIPRNTYPIVALEKLAQRCPDLKLLVIPPPDPAPPAGVEASDPPTYTHALESLSFLRGKWPEETFKMCAKYLMHIFPNLREDMISIEDAPSDLSDFRLKPTASTVVSFTMTIKFGPRVPSERQTDIQNFILQTVDKSTELYRVATSPRNSDYVIVTKDWSKSTSEPKEHLIAEVYYNNVQQNTNFIYQDGKVNSLPGAPAAADEAADEAAAAE